LYFLNLSSYGDAAGYDELAFQATGTSGSKPERPARNKIYCKVLVDKTIFLAKYNILILHEIVINTINIDFLRDD